MAGETDPTPTGTRDYAIQQDQYRLQRATIMAVHAHTAANDGNENTVDVQFVAPPRATRENVPLNLAHQHTSPALAEGMGVWIGFQGSDRSPVVEGFYANEDEAPPTADAGAFSRQVGEGSLIQHPDGEWELSNGQGASIRSNGGQIILDSEDIQSPTGPITGGYGGGATGQLPDTDPDASPQERAEQAGLTIQNTVQATATSDIGSAANTLYIVDGTLSWDGPIEISGVEDTAICGANDATIPIPAGFRDSYAVHIDGGQGAMFSGVDFDQTASGARGRIWMHVATRGFIEYHQTNGSGRRANPTPNEPLGHKSGPWISPAATTSGGRIRIKNVGSVHNGVLAVGPPGNRHFGDRPSGMLVQPPHRGRIDVIGSHFESFPNNGIYATNMNGSVHIRDTDAINCGVAGLRSARGTMQNCTVVFDYTQGTLDNADAPHGLNGYVVEQDIRGGDVDIADCTCSIPNATACGGAIKVRSGTAGTFENVDVHVGDGAGGAPDVLLDGTCEAITGCEFSGSSNSGTSIVNRSGTPVALSNNTFDYPSGRSQVSGPTK